MAERYEVTHTDDPFESVVLTDNEANARVTLAPERGGMVTRFKVSKDEVLYLDESTLRDRAKSVRGGIPVLFPIAGRLAGDELTLPDGEPPRPMKQHGFARTLPWAVTRESARGAAEVVLELRATDATREQYPFEFALRFTYSLRDGALTITQRFANEGDRPMPVQPGLHPYFRIPDARKKGAKMVTDAKNAWDNAAGARISVKRPIDLAAAEVDLHLLDHGPRSATLVRPGDRPVVLSFGDDQRVLVVWTLGGKDFVCVEPWSAPANALNEGGAITVKPGSAHETTLTIALG